MGLIKDILNFYCIKSGAFNPFINLSDIVKPNKYYKRFTGKSNHRGRGKNRWLVKS